jgi:hypothetical protein
MITKEKFELYCKEHNIIHNFTGKCFHEIFLRNNFDEKQIFIVVCYYGLLEVAKWIYSSCNINVHVFNDEAFKCSCYNGHLEVAKWLYYDVGDINIHIENDYVFIMSCSNGHLEVAKWLYSLGNVNIHFQNDKSFCFSCIHGHLEVAKWLYSLGNVETEEPFNMCCYALKEIDLKKKFNSYYFKYSEIIKWFLFDLGYISRIDEFHEYHEIIQKAIHE